MNSRVKTETVQLVLSVYKLFSSSQTFALREGKDRKIRENSEHMENVFHVFVLRCVYCQWETESDLISFLLMAIKRGFAQGFSKNKESIKNLSRKRELRQLG